MNLLHWIETLQSCESQPELLDRDGVEISLDILYERAESSLVAYESPNDNVAEQFRGALVEMAQVLFSLCEDLDSFLEGLDFRWLRLAQRKALDLIAVGAQLRADLLRAELSDSFTI